MSGHLPSGCSACLTDAECQGRCHLDEGCQGICLLNAAHVLQMQNVKANVLRTTHATASAFPMRSVRTFAFWMQHVSYRCRVSRQMSSGRGVSGHLPSERSMCLTDAECQCIFLPDAEYQGKCRTDDMHHGICLLDPECQCICLLNAASVLQT